MPALYKSKKPSRKDQSAARLENFRKEVITDSHTISLEELCGRFDTDPVTGLSPEQAKDFLKTNGPNVLTPARKKSEIAKFLGTLFHGFSNLLWIGVVLCFISVAIEYGASNELNYNHLVLGSVLMGVVFLTALFVYVEERKSQSVMDSFANLVPQKAEVLRGGAITTINTNEVVLGDLVSIKFGDRVPADIRILSAQNLKVDNSPITGESEPLLRGIDSTSDNILETRNVAFFSTNVVEGTGQGIVIACGDHTVMGHVAGLTARLKPNKTPMAKELDRFMKIISVWAISLGVLFGVIYISLGHTIISTLLFAIGIIVANVPEGLLVTVVICLTVTAKRMAVRNCLIKKLDSVETLGCTSVICSDKTGTLTQNRMTVCHIWVNGKVYPVDYDDIGKKSPNNDQAFKALIRCATLCSQASFYQEDPSKPILHRKVRGDASEAAILKYVTILQLYDEVFRSKNPKLVEIPFSSATKYQTSVHFLEVNSRCVVVMKGAPEVILERCGYILQENNTKEMSAVHQEACNSACLHFAEMGERVLAFCDLELDENYGKNYRFSTEPANFPQRGLRFLGLMAMIDPPRPEVGAAIEKCQRAGIKVAMVTGDHPVTAKAIAIKVGIITGDTIHEFTNVKNLRTSPSFINASIAISSDSNEDEGALVLHGNVLRHLLEEELDSLLFYHKEIVFARTSPTQKLQIVEGYQRLGEIVAVTGDGVNDAPALKKADTGIAMGITGTEVSQQAADIILLDDNFASIITGIEEGRRIFDNLKKSITYTLASNVPEIIPFMMYAFAGIPQPLDVIAILCIDLLTDMLPAISLAYEKAERDIMLRPPRNPLRDRLVNRKLYFLAFGNLGLLEAFGSLFVYFVVMAEHGFLPGRLLGIREEWESTENNVTDSYGRDWNFPQRMQLQDTCSSACMMSVVVAQWMNLLACKTRLNSLLKQGMGNMILNVSLLVETIFACLLIYCPKMYYLKFFPIAWRLWFYALPFGILLFLFDEARKWHIRKYPKGWYQRETFY